MGNSHPVTLQNSYGFNKSTPAREVAQKCGVDLSEKNLLITGCTNGIGRETVRAFAVMKNGPKTIIMCNRNKEASEALSKELLAECKSVGVERSADSLVFVPLDLAKIKSVEAAAKNVNDMNIPLHIMIQNAGIFEFDAYTETEDGYERAFQINCFSHFIFGNRLLEKMELAGTESQPARMVVVASHSHYGGFGNLEQFPLTKKNYKNGNHAYEQSKLGNVLFARELNKRMKAQNKPIRAFSLHPATAAYSNIGNNSSLVRILPSLIPCCITKAGMYVLSAFTRSLEQAAATSVFCAIEPSLAEKGDGKYYDHCDAVKESDAVTDDLCEKFWDRLSEMANL